jgi:hypothetical protein
MVIGLKEADMTCKSIVIDGVEYTPNKTIEGNRAVVVVDRGWIFAGDVTRKDNRIYLKRAVWVFRWESVGFSAVISDPKKAKADIRPVDDVEIPAASEVFSIPVPTSWGL